MTGAARESRSQDEKPRCTWHGTHFHEDVIVQMGRSDAGVSSGGHVGSQLNKCPLETRATPRARLPPSPSLSLPPLDRRRGIGGAHVSSSMRNSNRGWLLLMCVAYVRPTFRLSMCARVIYVCIAYICVARARIAATIFRHTRTIARVRLKFLINRFVWVKSFAFTDHFVFCPRFVIKLAN